MKIKLDDGKHGKVVHIRGGGFRNKGAELMLVAAAAWVRENVSDARIAVNYQVGTTTQRRNLGLDDLFWVEHHRSRAVMTMYNLFASLYRARGLVSDESVRPLLKPGDWTDSAFQRTVKRIRLFRVARGQHTVLGRDVDVILDISGYAYGDNWGPRNAEMAASYYADVRRRGGRIVLLPQQLGPFEKEGVRDAFRKMAEQCDIIFARDEKSYLDAADVLGDTSRLRVGPDFTVLQEGNHDHGHSVDGHACIVPNYRMLEATDPDEAAEYPRFLQRCIEYLDANSVPTVVVVHEDDERDTILAREVAQIGGLDLIKESDPLKLKGLIGSCYLMIGSRFHGLVSALSQNVPAVGTGWSHKYRMLFKDYDQEGALLSVFSTESEIAESLSSRLEPTANEKERARLRIHSDIQKKRARVMWSELRDLLDVG